MPYASLRERAPDSLAARVGSTRALDPIEEGEMSQNRSPADLVFTGGAVYTVDAALRWAQAVAIQDGRIVAVGSDAE